jgi:hypothetical protein
VLAQREGLPQSALDELAHPLHQRVAAGMLRALDRLESQPWTPDLIPTLQATLGPDIT